MIRAVLFDLDGTLCDTEAYVLNAFNYALSSQGLRKVSIKVIAHYAGWPLHKVFRYVTGRKNVEALVKLYFNYQKKHPKLIMTYPAVKKVLAALAKKKIKLAVVTGSYRISAHNKLSAAGITKYFHVIIAGDDDGDSKPSPAPYLRAAKLLKVKPSECLVVGDGASDIESGKRAGCIVARAMYSYCASEPTRYKPDFKVNSLKEIAKIVQNNI